MANAYCPNCRRNVGVEKKRSCGAVGLIVVFIILGLIVPLWFISLPIFWGLALITFLFSGAKRCGICSSTQLEPYGGAGGIKKQKSSLASKPEEEFIGSSDNEKEIVVEPSEKSEE